MLVAMLATIFWTTALLTTQVKTPDNLADTIDRKIYPMSKALPVPPVEVDAKEAPDMALWGEAAKKLVIEWYPHICSLLATEKYQAPKKIRLVLRKQIDPPAYATGGEIHIKSDWIREHPDDLGMIIHELTHVIQGYPDSDKTPGWLVEGVADYIRWWRYEAGAPRTRIDFSKATYHDAYRTTAAWLAWTSYKYDMRLVPTLDRDMREGKDPMPEFERLTGKSPDTLWDEFKAAWQ